MTKAPAGDVAPPVQKVRLRYAKRGRMRFASHRDFQRILERALRRMRAPMAYSAGFNPHPKISFANAAPTGTASEAEYVELGLATIVDPNEFAKELSAALPDGFDIVNAVEAASGKIADTLEASIWRIEVKDLALDDAEKAADAFESADDLSVTRVTKKGERHINVSAAVISLSVDRVSVQHSSSPCAIITVVVRHTTPVVRPDDIVTVLCQAACLAPERHIIATRLAQGQLDDAQCIVADPLGPIVITN